MPDKNNYCVYLHERKDKPGHIFYCGSGLPMRPYSKKKSGRNEYWLRIIAKFGYIVHIIASNLTREESLCLEGFIAREWKDNNMCEACLDIPEDGKHYTFSEISKLKISEKKRARDKLYKKVWVTDKVKSKHIPESELDTYLAKGWIRGREFFPRAAPAKSEERLAKSSAKAKETFTGSIWITDGQEELKILKQDEEKLNSYLAKGYRKGRSPRMSSKLKEVCVLSSHPCQGKILVSLEKDSLFVEFNLLPDFIERGYKIGKPGSLVKPGKTWYVNKDGIQKCVQTRDILEYSKNNWNLGKIKKRFIG